ncbi:MAG: hypothetical protein Q7J38_00005, partial [Gallionella sp.]|nr:hypothetical protein [Gallionella sp.]
MKAKIFDQQFDKGVDITGSLDLSKSKRVLQEQKRVNVDFPTWMIESLDREARKLGVTRQPIIKVWLAERLEAPPLTLRSSGTAQKRAAPQFHVEAVEKPKSPPRSAIISLRDKSKVDATWHGS